MKVRPWDKRLTVTYLESLGVIGAITSIILIFPVSDDSRIAIGVAAIILWVVFCVGVWIYANCRQSIKLQINSSEVEVKFGNLFDEKADLKVIAFNEYFDTLVDNQLIASGTLNGKFIQSHYQDRVSELDDKISDSLRVGSKPIKTDAKREIGKKDRYRLGTVCVVDDYLLTALTHFEGTKAYVEMSDYIDFLLHFWIEVDRVYAQRTVALPVLGSGITRFKGYEDITDQELLQLIIWSFKVSRIKFTYPSKVKIVVFSEKSDKINLTALKDLQ